LVAARLVLAVVELFLKQGPALVSSCSEAVVVESLWTLVVEEMMTH